MTEQQQERPIRQYAIEAGAYHPCGDTKPRVPPGFYNVANSMRGHYLEPRVAVSDDLIDIPGTVADEVFADIDAFLAGKRAYAQYGLTHKRGYLFHGPPGSGKTSIGLMIAKRFVERIGGVVMYAGDARSFIGGVNIMRDVEPGRPSMYLMEEVDRVANYTECLSILDGELSIQGAVFVAMTNYRDKLPPRLVNRPGRFDRVILVDCPPAVVQIEYLRRVEARVGDRPEVARQIVEALAGLPVSLAHLREAFVSHVLMRMSLAEVRDRFEEMAGLKKPPEEAKAAADPDDEPEDEEEDPPISIEDD